MLILLVYRATRNSERGDSALSLCQCLDSGLNPMRCCMDAVGIEVRRWRLRPIFLLELQFFHSAFQCTTLSASVVDLTVAGTEASPVFPAEL